MSPDELRDRDRPTCFLHARDHAVHPRLDRIAVGVDHRDAKPGFARLVHLHGRRLVIVKRAVEDRVVLVRQRDQRHRGGLPGALATGQEDHAWDQVAERIGTLLARLVHLADHLVVRHFDHGVRGAAHGAQVDPPRVRRLRIGREQLGGVIGAQDSAVGLAVELHELRRVLLDGAGRFLLGLPGVVHAPHAARDGHLAQATAGAFHRLPHKRRQRQRLRSAERAPARHSHDALGQRRDRTTLEIAFDRLLHVLSGLRESSVFLNIVIHACTRGAALQVRVRFLRLIDVRRL